MADFILPLPQQTPLFSFDIDLSGEFFTLRFQYNKREDSWYMDILNSETREELRTGIKVVVNQSLLNTYRDLDESPKGNFVAFNTQEENNDPNFETFGNEVKILYSEF